MQQEHVVKGEQRDEEEAELNTKGRLNSVKELSGREIDRVKKLSREAERSPVHSLGGREPSLVKRSSPKAKHDQRKMIEPVRTS